MSERIKKVKKQKALKNNDELWICGQWQEDYKMWEFQGVFSNRVKAIKACKNERYFIFPSSLNKELPMETVIPDGFEYPYNTKEKS
jgi:hypothetical protein